MSRALSLALAALVLAPAGALAQTPAATATPPAAAGGWQPAEELLARMPADMLGARAFRSANSPMITYFAEDMLRDPSFAIFAIRQQGNNPAGDLRTEARNAFHETGIRRVLREGSFTTPHWPNGNTFFGEYLTNLGLKQRWTVETGAEVLIVTATILRPADRERAQAEVAQRIFGGAVVTAAAPAREPN
jgi:hypothetical protein